MNQLPRLRFIDHFTGNHFLGEDGIPELLVGFGGVLARLENSGGLTKGFFAGITVDMFKSRIHITDRSIGFGQEYRFTGFFDAQLEFV